MPDSDRRLCRAHAPRASPAGVRPRRRMAHARSRSRRQSCRGPDSVTGDWSIDARVLVRPARAFRSLADTPAGTHRHSSIWIAARRPLFLTLVLASVASLVGTSVATTPERASRCIW